MKFIYEYRTSDNVRHDGVIEASDREAAFQQLKARGIRPGRLTEAPGFFNKLFGKGKRWIAIVMLAVLLVAILVSLSHEKTAEHQAVRYAFEDRAQIFGDPSLMQKLAKDGWRETFPDVGEAWFARHAIPGKLCDCSASSAHETSRDDISTALIARKDKLIAIEENDPDELKKMKRMINGMKREFSEYVESPSDAYDYIEKACARCRAERGIADRIAAEIARLEKQLEEGRVDRTAIFADWDRENATLRSLGLSTIPQPE